MKKICLFMLALILLFSFAQVGASAAYEEEIEYPCGGVIEGVQVDVLYLPLSSRIAIGNSEPTITGTILLITYPDGEREVLTVEKSGNVYFAGDFSVSVWNFGKEAEYGFAEKSIYLYYDKFFGGYSGEFKFTYIHFPSLTDVFDLIDSHIMN